MKGWYIPVNPGETAGERSVWYTSCWGFCAAYLNERFGSNWSLSPEQSLLLHVGNMTVPRQLLVRSPKARNRVTKLLHGTSLLDTRARLPADKDVSEKEGLRLFSVSAGVVYCGAGFFSENPTDARAALAMIADAADVLGLLLEDGRSTVAGRLAGAFRNVGRDRVADDIVKTMRAADYEIREKDPFKNTISAILPAHQVSPYVNRIRLMWENMRGPIIKQFPPAPGRPPNIDGYLKAIDEIYAADAYHSLSIEGYRVSSELIKRVRKGDWHPEENKEDRDHLNALTARGYWLMWI